MNAPPTAMRFAMIRVNEPNRRDSMRRASYSPLEQNPPQGDYEEPGDALLTPEEEPEAPSWANFRARILSFTRGRSKSPTLKSPGSKSPTCRSPTGRSPMSRSPASRSPSSRSPTSNRSPARSPSSRSPTCQSPVNRSPTSKSPPLRSPTQRWAPTPLALKRGSFSRGSSRESRGSRESPTGALEPIDTPPSRRNSASKVKRCLKKAFSLNLEGAEVDDGGEIGSPVAGAAALAGEGQGGGRSRGRRGGRGRMVKLKIRSSPVEQVLEMTQLEDDERTAAAARRARKWSYHGTATPASPVEAPKRHSFSTGTDRSGIVVTNNDLVSLLGPTHRLTPPGLPVPEALPAGLPIMPNPRARGRSQSIAVCWDAKQNASSGGDGDADGPQVPITIRRTDCDYVAAPLVGQAGTLEAPEEEDEAGEEADKGEVDESKLQWDSSGSTIDAGLLGSAIEKYLKTSRDVDSGGSVASALTGLQVK
nr:cyclin-dependent kinase 12-like [Penaeus vannamei]